MNQIKSTSLGHIDFSVFSVVMKLLRTLNLISINCSVVFPLKCYYNMNNVYLIILQVHGNFK